MNWLENNPLGVALASVCGLLLLLSVVLVVAWKRPAASGAGPAEEASSGTGMTAEWSAEIGPLSEFRVVNERPVFNESRRPVVQVDDEGPELVEDKTVVSAAPEVTLTGVVITPDTRIVTLKPKKGGEAIIFREGVPMEGDYSGWLVSKVDPRKVSLESMEGDVVELELVVHDSPIAEPPRPEPAGADEAAKAAPEPAAGEEGEPLTRAEEIRQRIAERREQLRREAADREAAAAPPPKSDYQAAIRALMNPNKKSDKDSDENEQ